MVRLLALRYISSFFRKQVFSFAFEYSGSSDPYIVLAYSKFGKPLYSTRIISKDLNPVFEETCALLVTADEIKAEESLSVMLWDSDGSSCPLPLI